MDLVQAFLNMVIPPMGLFFLALSYPPLAFMNACLWFLSFIFRENVHGKVVVITGATSGIGEHLSYEYATHGAKLILVGNQEELLREVAAKCQRIGASDVRIVTADLGHEEECKRFVEETVHQFGRLDHLVNNAGIMNSFLFEEATDAANFQPIMNVTFWGSVYPTYYALPHLKRTGGKVVVNSSVSAWLPMPRLAIYNAAEAALFNFFDTLRVEVGNSIGVTIATPGWTESEITRGKFISSEGEQVLKPDLRDVTVGPVPVTYAEECAKAIFSGTVRGARYVRVPSWYGITQLYRVFAPELIEWTYRVLFVCKAPGADVPAAKLLMDVPGAKEILYPSSVLQPTTFRVRGYHYLAARMPDKYKRKSRQRMLLHLARYQLQNRGTTGEQASRTVQALTCVSIKSLLLSNTFLASTIFPHFAYMFIKLVITNLLDDNPLAMACEYAMLPHPVSPQV